jgi:large subunit ribosomal protein L7/L12
MMNKDEILQAIEEMKVLELVELVAAIEERFGVSAAMPVAAVAPAPSGDGAGGDSGAEQTEFDVILSDAGSQKIQVIKAVREITGLGLKEAKSIGDSARKAVKEKISEKEANDLKDKLAAVGAVVEVK